MNFFRPKTQTRWLIERERPGQYHNSPNVWSQVGQIRANTRREAVQKASEVMPYANVRVTPIEES